jgi:hypothetical protein
VYAQESAYLVGVRDSWDSQDCAPCYWRRRGMEWKIGYIRCAHSRRVAWLSSIRFMYLLVSYEGIGIPYGWRWVMTRLVHQPNGMLWVFLDQMVGVEEHQGEPYTGIQILNRLNQSVGIWLWTLLQFVTWWWPHLLQ